MFAPNRLQRQVLATIALLALSIVPSTLVIGWAWQATRAGHVRDVEVELSARLGLQVGLQGVRHPRPDQDELIGVVLRGEEPASDRSRLAEIARADLVRLTRSGHRITLEARGLRLAAGTPEEAVARLETLAGRLAGAEVQVDLVARSAILETLDSDGRRTERPVAELAATWRREPGRATLSASGLVDLGDSINPAPRRCELQLTRLSDGPSPTLEARLQTLDGPVPASLLASFFDADAWLGPEATADGLLAWSRPGPAGTPWEGRFHGTLAEIDLDTLVSSRFPGHRLRGRARVAIEDARWGPLPAGQGGGWRLARGRLASGPGAIGTDLLGALASELRFRLDAPPLPNDDVPFAALGLSFALDESGEIRIAGALGDDLAPDTVLARPDRTAALARAPQGAANVRGLWKALVFAHGDVLVPATPEAQVFRHLPLPRANPSADTSLNAN